MSSRFLLFAGFAAALICADQAAAQRGRDTRPVPAPAAVASPAKEAKEPLTQTVYAVADLVIPIPTRPNLDVEPLPSREANRSRLERFMRDDVIRYDLQAERRTNEESLINLVTATVAPQSWSAQGGPGTIQYFSLGHALIVNNTKAVHNEVRELLRALQRLQAVEVVLESRVLQVTPAALQNARGELRFATKETKLPLGEEPGKWVITPKGKGWTALLNKNQVASLLRTVQGDRASLVSQPPKLTMANGQIALLETTDQEWFTSRAVVSYDGDDLRMRRADECFTSGLRLALKPVASADRKAVQLEMNGYWSALSGPVEEVALETKRYGKNADNDPAGALIERPRYSQVRVCTKTSIQVGSSLLVNTGVVPTQAPRENFGSWLFECVTGVQPTMSVDRNVLILVTPRIIVNEVEELPLLLNLQPVPRP